MFISTWDYFHIFIHLVQVLIPTVSFIPNLEGHNIRYIDHYSLSTGNILCRSSKRQRISLDLRPIVQMYTFKVLFYSKWKSVSLHIVYIGLYVQTLVCTYSLYIWFDTSLVDSLGLNMQCQIKSKVLSDPYVKEVNNFTFSSQ